MGASSKNGGFIIGLRNGMQSSSKPGISKLDWCSTSESCFHSEVYPCTWSKKFWGNWLWCVRNTLREVSEVCFTSPGDPGIVHSLSLFLKLFRVLLGREFLGLYVMGFMTCMSFTSLSRWRDSAVSWLHFSGSLAWYDVFFTTFSLWPAASLTGQWWNPWSMIEMLLFGW